jgi:hypothetical protein
MFIQYEEFKLVIRRGDGASECANLPLLMGDLILAAIRAPQLPLSN